MNIPFVGKTTLTLPNLDVPCSCAPWGSSFFLPISKQAFLVHACPLLSMAGRFLIFGSISSGFDSGLTNSVASLWGWTISGSGIWRIPQTISDHFIGGSCSAKTEILDLPFSCVGQNPYDHEYWYIALWKLCRLPISYELVPEIQALANRLPGKNQKCLASSLGLSAKNTEILTLPILKVAHNENAWNFRFEPRAEIWEGRFTMYCSSHYSIFDHEAQCFCAYWSSTTNTWLLLYVCVCAQIV